MGYKIKCRSIKIGFDRIMRRHGLNMDNMANTNPSAYRISYNNSHHLPYIWREFTLIYLFLCIQTADLHSTNMQSKGGGTGG